jgi:hypothetical protein
VKIGRREGIAEDRRDIAMNVATQEGMLREK